MGKHLTQMGILQLRIVAFRQEDRQKEVEQNLPIIEGSGTVCEMRDLTQTLIRILTAKGMQEEDAKVLIASYTSNVDLLAILDEDTKSQKS